MKVGSIVVIVINLLWLIPMIIYFIRSGMRESKNVAFRKHLLETGQVATAKIVNVKQAGPYYSKVPHLEFELEVTGKGGERFRAGARGFFQMIDFPRLQPGMVVEVRYDPNAKDVVGVVGDTLA